MRESSKKLGVFGQIIVAVVVTLTVGGSAPWWWPKLFPPQGENGESLRIEIGSGFVKAVNAGTGEPIEGAQIYVEPRNGRGPLMDDSGNPVHWTTDPHGIAAPLIIPSWEPVPSPAGPIHEFDFIAEKAGFKIARRYAYIPAGQSAGSQLPFYASPPR
jgi:hypothetical protein